MRGIAYVRELEEDEEIEHGLMLNLIEKFANSAGMQSVVIDKTKTMRKTNGNVFWTFQECMDKYPDHRFVFLDVNSKKDFKTCPQRRNEDVIFCIGGDVSGFDVDLEDKEAYKIIPSTVSPEMMSVVVAGFVAADKHMREK